MRLRHVLGVVLLGSVLGVQAPASAQDKSAKSTEAKGDVQSIYDVGAIISQASKNVGARYNLNKEQQAVTDKMFEERVNLFLSEHADSLYPIVRDLVQGKFIGENLTVSQRKRVGKGGSPLIEEAKKAILEANAEWRNILSTEQQQLHDWDLAEMENQFTQINENFDKMKLGLPVDNPIFPEPKIQTDPPPMPTKPGGGIPKPPPPLVVKNTLDMFEAYVAQFIKDYKLDPAQQLSAESMMRDYKRQADDHRRRSDAKYASAKKKTEQARASGDLKKINEADAETDALNGRITELFEAMKERLMSIPRKAQKRAFEESSGPEAKAAKDNKTKPSTKSNQKKTPDKKGTSESKKS